MKIKLGNKIYDPQQEPMLIILDPIDRLNIIAMKPEANIYASYPKGMARADVEKFMDLGKPRASVVEVPTVPTPLAETKKPEIVKP